jgi:hypothetical protein
MNPLENMLEKIALPIPLPAEVFVVFGKKRKMPDFEFIFNEVLPQLNPLLLPNGTARMADQDVYIFELISEGQVAIKLAEQSITEVAYVHPIQNSSETARILLKQLKK